MRNNLYLLNIFIFGLLGSLLSGASVGTCFGGPDIPQECIDNPGTPSVICRVEKNSTVDDCIGRFQKIASPITECECTHPEGFNGIVIAVVTEDSNKNLVVTYFADYEKDADGDGAVDICDKYDSDPSKE